MRCYDDALSNVVQREELRLQKRAHDMVLYSCATGERERGGGQVLGLCSCYYCIV